MLPPGLQHYWKADFVRGLTDEAIAAHVEHGARVPCVESTIHVYPINGACHRVASDATAFAYREANFACVIAGMWPDALDNEPNIAWVRDYWEAIHPHSEQGGYVNFMASDHQDRVRDNYRELPETFVSVYPSNSWAHQAATFSRANELWERPWLSSVDVPGPLVDELVAACRSLGIHAVIGVNERESERPGTLYNTMVWLGPGGVLQKHRKLMPTPHERLFHGIDAAMT